MQGYSPHEAFATLPRSLRGAHEETLMAAQIAPAEVEEEPVWSLDREQVYVASLVPRPSAPPVFDQWRRRPVNEAMQCMQL